jgi:hypothetical protein
MVALLLWLDIQPSWSLAIWFAVLGFVFIIAGASIDAVRDVIREIREERL